MLRRFRLITCGKVSISLGAWFWLACEGGQIPWGSRLLEAASNSRRGVEEEDDSTTTPPNQHFSP